jgi:hypothetical protein
VQVTGQVVGAAVRLVAIEMDQLVGEPAGLRHEGAGHEAAEVELASVDAQSPVRLPPFPGVWRLLAGRAVRAK